MATGLQRCNTPPAKQVQPQTYQKYQNPAAYTILPKAIFPEFPEAIHTSRQTALLFVVSQSLHHPDTLHHCIKLPIGLV